MKPNLNRPDGRPEAYAMVKNQPCNACVVEGNHAAHPVGKVVLMPGHQFTDGIPRMMCIEKHIPENTVIFEPTSGVCRDKAGNVWRE